MRWGRGTAGREAKARVFINSSMNTSVIVRFGLHIREHVVYRTLTQVETGVFGEMGRKF